MIFSFIYHRNVAVFVTLLKKTLVVKHYFANKQQGVNLATASNWVETGKNPKLLHPSTSS
jgi:hypothetical protein